MLCYIYLSNSEHNFTTDELVSTFNKHFDFDIPILEECQWGIKNFEEEMQKGQEEVQKGKLIASAITREARNISLSQFIANQGYPSIKISRWSFHSKVWKWLI